MAESLTIVEKTVFLMELDYFRNMESEQVANRIAVGLTGQIGFDDLRQRAGFRAVPEHVDEGHEEASFERLDHDGIPAHLLSGTRADRARVLQPSGGAQIHLRAVTRVPSPGVDSSENSSIMRFTAGRPSPMTVSPGLQNAR